MSEIPAEREDSLLERPRTGVDHARAAAAVRELLLVAALFLAYKAGRLLTAGDAARARGNAAAVWHLERLLLMFKGFECINGAHSAVHRTKAARPARAPA